MNSYVSDGATFDELANKLQLKARPLLHYDAVQAYLSINPSYHILSVFHNLDSLYTPPNILNVSLSECDTCLLPDPSRAHPPAGLQLIDHNATLSWVDFIQVDHESANYHES